MLSIPRVSCLPAATGTRVVDLEHWPLCFTWFDACCRLAGRFEFLQSKEIQFKDLGLRDNAAFAILLQPRGEDA